MGDAGPGGMGSQFCALPSASVTEWDLCPSTTGSLLHHGFHWTFSPAAHLHATSMATCLNCLHSHSGPQPFLQVTVGSVKCLEGG